MHCSILNWVLAILSAKRIKTHRHQPLLQRYIHVYDFVDAAFCLLSIIHLPCPHVLKWMWVEFKNQKPVHGSITDTKIEVNLQKAILQGQTWSWCLPKNILRASDTRGRFLIIFQREMTLVTSCRLSFASSPLKIESTLKGKNIHFCTNSFFLE